MAVTKITFENKTGIQNDASVARKNKVVDEDMNEIKQVVNNNADEVAEIQKNIEDLQGGQGTADTDIASLKNRVNTLETDNTQNKSDINILKNDNETNKSNISTLQENVSDLETNKVSKVDGMGLSEENFSTGLKNKLAGLKNYDDTELQEKVSALEGDNETNKSNIEELQEDNIQNKADITDIKEEQETQNEKINTSITKNEAQDELISKLKNALINAETEEAKSLHVTDANKFGQLEILGNHEQETREGYNILDYLDNIKTSTNGLTISKDEIDGYITVNGTPASNHVSVITGSTDIIDLLEDGQTYTMWQENHSESDLGGIYLQIIRSNKDDGGNVQYWTSSINNYTFTVDKSLYKYAANIQTGPISQVGTFNNYRNRYMIYKGTDEKEFELYGASPSPDYPSKVVCLGSNKNEFNIQNTRILNNTELDSVDENSITFTNNGLGVNRQVFIECYLKAGTYTIQREFEILEGTGTESSGAVALYQANTWKQSLLTATDKTKTFTITESNTYRIRLGINDSNSMTENVKIKFYDIKIEEGTEATSYSPYRTR